MSYPLPQHLKKIPHFEFKRLMSQVVTLQNGTISHQMGTQGLHYDLNYGVQIPLLRELVKDSQPENALAYLLWNQNIRESKLLATWLFNPETLEPNKILAILTSIHNIELAEQMARNSLFRAPDLKNYVMQMPTLGNYGAISVILAVSRASELKIINEKLSIELFHVIVKQIELGDLKNIKQTLLTLFQKISKYSESCMYTVNQTVNNALMSQNKELTEAAKHYLWLTGL